ncbi:MAG: peptide deformylase [Chloroflexota bacterium]|nr:peptide deformylase [Chloroflexota bacterium]
MAVLPLTYIPDNVLRKKTRKVTKLTSEMFSLIEDMIETMHVEHGVGIAANQVGRNLRIAYIEIPEEPEENGEVSEKLSYLLINPEIIKRVGTREVDEGCLSIPGFRGNLIRSVKVTVRAQDIEGKEFRIKAENLLAQALEHEIDHLNGIVYIDRMQDPERLYPLDSQEKADSETSIMTTNVWNLRRPAQPVVRKS